MIEIELRRHIGQAFDRKAGKVVEVEHAQYIVLARIDDYFGRVNCYGERVPVQIGYIGNWPGAQLAHIPVFLKIPVNEREAVRQAVVQKLAEVLDDQDDKQQSGLPEQEPETVHEP